jgi:hypothetical protein
LSGLCPLGIYCKIIIISNSIKTYGAYPKKIVSLIKYRQFLIDAKYITTREDDMSFTLFFDGACRGNPGPMAIGAVLLENGKKVKELSENIGRGTNNIAEWNALIGGLKLALAHGCRELEVKGDSQLVIRQISGKYRLKVRILYRFLMKRRN